MGKTRNTGFSNNAIQYSSGSISFTSGSTTRMFISASGNVGMGTTNPTQRLSVSGSIESLIETTYEGGQLILRGNTYRYNLDNFSGSLRIFRENDSDASSGIVQMFISSSGNVGMGTSIPYEIVSGNVHLDLRSSTYSFLEIGTTTSVTSSDVGYLEFMNGNNKRLATIVGGADGTNLAGYMRFSTANSSGNFTERMRITSTGYFGIGTISPSSKVTIIRDSPYNTGDQAIRIRAIDGDGYNLWMGASSNGYSTIQSYQDNVGGKLLLLNPLNGGGVTINTTSQDSGAVLTISQGTSVGTSYVSTGTGTTGVLYFKNGNGVVGQIYTNGSSTTYSTSSDYRLKKNFKDFNGLEKVSAVKVYDFEWESDNTQSYGVVAHELAEVLPYAVNGEKDAMWEDGTIKAQGVDYSKLVPVLLKAIQELKAEIEELKNK